MITLLSISLFGEYESGKIDMHGGKNYNEYESSHGSFAKTRISLSTLLDKNTSKSQEKIKK
jgi:hypothetical protein